MASDVTAIITVRDRDTDRIGNLISSLRINGADCEFLVVDYGSSPSYAEAYCNLARQLNFRVLRLETQGWPWNKCHAINAGVKESTTSWIATIDVDMIFECNPFPFCLANEPVNKLQVMQTWWLPEDGNKARATFGGKGHPGPFNFQSRESFDRLGGYDEKIVFWGMEDWDWPRRLEGLGYSVEWLPEEYRFYHVWHPTSNDVTARPNTAWFDTAAAYTNNLVDPVLNQPWGHCTSGSDRPVLQYLPRTDLPRFQLAPNSWIDRFPDLMSAIANHSVLWVDLGPRKIGRKFSSWSWVKTWIDRLATPFGLTVSPLLNSNYDFWYSTRDAISRLGVRDWYLNPQRDSILFYREG